MVVIPRMIEQIPVDLPGVFNPDPKLEYRLEPMTLTITADKEYYIEEQRFPSVEAIEEELRFMRQETPDRRIFVKADSSLPFKNIRPLLEKLQGLGFKGTGFVVGAKHKGERK
jgi:biopolymer transport protein TolR